MNSAEDCSCKPVRMPALGKEFPQPEMSLIENAMFQANPDLEDHQWRKQFFGDMPHYLSRYFAVQLDNQAAEQDGSQDYDQSIIQVYTSK